MKIIRPAISKWIGAHIECQNCSLVWEIEKGDESIPDQKGIFWESYSAVCPECDGWRDVKVVKKPTSSSYPDYRDIEFP